MNLSKNAKCTRLSNALAAGTGTTNCTAVDTKGFKSTTFYLLLGAVGVSSPHGTVQLKILQSPNESASPDDYADLAGTGQTLTTTGDNQVLIVEVDSARERYLRPVIVRSGGTAVVDGLICLQTKAHAEPVAHDSSTVGGSEFHLAPAEGTA